MTLEQDFETTTILGHPVYAINGCISTYCTQYHTHLGCFNIKH